MPVLLDAAGSSHADLRQCAVYGVGVGAALAPDLFKPHAPAALAAVTSIISAPVSLRLRNVQAALGCLWHGDACGLLFALGCFAVAAVVCSACRCAILLDVCCPCLEAQMCEAWLLAVSLVLCPDVLTCFTHGAVRVCESA
jgi:hypothetical protein